jgi:Flp pilus assembly protein CpaB
VEKHRCGIGMKAEAMMTEEKVVNFVIPDSFMDVLLMRQQPIQLQSAVFLNL